MVWVENRVNTVFQAEKDGILKTFYWRYMIK
jgi:hypothetical protein